MAIFRGGHPSKKKVGGAVGGPGGVGSKICSISKISFRVVLVYLASRKKLKLAFWDFLYFIFFVFRSPLGTLNKKINAIAIKGKPPN